MKCLLCARQPPNTDELREHYVTFHRVDPNNWFYKNLLECINEIFRAGKCLCCKDFIIMLHEKKNHNFIRHYEERQIKPFELKTMGIKQYGLITKHEISLYKHKDEYDFYDTESVVNDFLKNVKNRFVPNNDVIIKVGFTIENIQPTPIIISRYWSTKPYKTKYFNDYIFFSLKKNIEKRVITNGMSGNS